MMGKQRKNRLAKNSIAGEGFRVLCVTVTHLGVSETC